MGFFDTLEKTQVKRDLTNKYVFLYGAPKTGKTSMAVQFPRNFLFGFENGFNALDGIYAESIDDWTHFKKRVRDFVKDPKGREMFDTVTIDTVSIAYDMCEDFICKNKEKEEISEIGYGKGHKLLKKEFENTMRSLQKAGYGVIFIGHSKSRTETDGQKSITTITPDLNDKCAAIINRMVDLTCYLGSEEDGNRYLYPRQTTFEVNKQKYCVYAGSHFAGLNEKIPMSYENLQKAVIAAMENDAKENNYTLSDEKVVFKERENIDLEEIKKNIGAAAKKLVKLDEALDDTEKHYKYDYDKMVEEYFGQGFLVKTCKDKSKADLLELLYTDILDYMKENNIE